MDLSLSEYRALVAKAFRGAGYPWGLAEEGAVTARVLAANDIAGTDAVVSLLRRIGSIETSTTMPDGSWTSAAGWLCPVSTGATLADAAPQLDTSRLELDLVAEPILLGPLLQRLTTDAAALLVSWDGGTLLCDQRLLTMSGAAPASVCPVTIETIAPTTATPNSSMRRTRVDVTDESLVALTGFAQLTYAPATEASRLAGAGSGLNDND